LLKRLQFVLHYFHSIGLVFVSRVHIRVLTRRVITLSGPTVGNLGHGCIFSRLLARLLLLQFQLRQGRHGLCVTCACNDYIVFAAAVFIDSWFSLGVGRVLVYVLAWLLVDGRGAREQELGLRLLVQGWSLLMPLNFFSLACARAGTGAGALVVTHGGGVGCVEQFADGAAAGRNVAVGLRG
jgi:hypothetical protein